jgi:hypothetical protein
MQQHPVTGIIGGKPKTRLKTAKEQIPLLSERYLKLRNRQMSHKAMEAELNLAIRRGQLISKDLVVKQASFLFIAMRQKILNLPHTYAPRLFGCKDVREVRKVLEGAAISILNEIRELPQKAVDPNWLEELEKEGK